MSPWELLTRSEEFPTTAPPAGPSTGVVHKLPRHSAEGGASVDNEMECSLNADAPTKVCYRNLFVEMFILDGNWRALKLACSGAPA
jgi:hypothetical protein